MSNYDYPVATGIRLNSEKLFRSLPTIPWGSAEPSGKVDTEPEDGYTDVDEIDSEDEDLTSAQLVAEAARILKLVELSAGDDTDYLLAVADRYVTLADIVSRYDEYGF